MSTYVIRQVRSANGTNGKQRDTLRSLGPKVLADRMVRDYVTTLYQPATDSARTLNDDYKGALELAAWKDRVRTAWSGVRIDHVDSSGVGDTPEVGAVMQVHGFVTLAGLSPDDVDVQVLDTEGVDHLLVGGCERGGAAARGLQVGTHRATERDHGVTAHGLQVLDLVHDARFAERDGAAPGRAATRG